MSKGLNYPIIEANDFMKRMFVEGYDNAISYYASIDSGMNDSVNTLSDTIVSGNIGDIETAFDAFSSYVNGIRNEITFRGEGTSTRAQGLFTSMRNSESANQLGDSGNDTFTEILQLRSDIDTVLRKTKRSVPASIREYLTGLTELLKEAVSQLFNIVGDIESSASSEVREVEDSLDRDDSYDINPVD